MRWTRRRRFPPIFAPLSQHSFLFLLHTWTFHFTSIPSPTAYVHPLLSIPCSSSLRAYMYMRGQWAAFLFLLPITLCWPYGSGGGGGGGGGTQGLKTKILPLSLPPVRPPPLLPLVYNISPSFSECVCVCLPPPLP